MAMGRVGARCWLYAVGPTMNAAILILLGTLLMYLVVTGKAAKVGQAIFG